MTSHLLLLSLLLGGAWSFSHDTEGDWRVSRRWVADDVLLESQPEAAYSWPPKHLRHHTSNDLDNPNIIKEGHLDDTAAHSQHKRKRKNHGRRNKHHKKHSPEHDHLTLLEGEEGKQLLQQHSHQSRLDTRKQRSQKHHKHLNEVLEATLTPTYPLKSHNSFFGLEENSSSLEDGVGDGEGFLSGVDDRRSERVITDRGAVVHDDVLALHSAPVFDKSLPAKVQAQLGAHAYLPCRIIHMGDKSVSWVRNADSHILTVDSYTFISDERFTARFDVSSQTWTLQIKFVTDHDAGAYECQVSTEPKISRSIQLSIVRPIVTIPGGSELHVRSGSDVTIKCVISQAIEPPSYVFWYHEGSEMLAGGRVVERMTQHAALASLVIRGVTRRHAGNYTCVPAGLTSASVTLHVLNDEHPAAMQHGTSTAAAAAAAVAAASTTRAGSTQLLLCCWCTLLLLLPSLRALKSAALNTRSFTSALINSNFVPR